MTSLPQTHPSTAQESRRRTAAIVPGSPEGLSGTARARARQTLPAVDPSTAFGCVDWFLYPDQVAGRSAVEAHA